MRFWPNVRAGLQTRSSPEKRARLAIDRRDLLDLLLVSSRLAQSRAVATPARTFGGIPAHRDAPTPAVLAHLRGSAVKRVRERFSRMLMTDREHRRRRWRWGWGQRNDSRSVHSLPPIGRVCIHQVIFSSGKRWNSIWNECEVRISWRETIDI